MSRRRASSMWRGAAVVTAVALGGAVIAAPPAAAATIEEVTVSQAGYSAGGYKVGFAVADGAVPGSTRCRILQASTPRIVGSANAVVTSAARASALAPSCRVVGYSTGISPVAAVRRRIACSCTAGETAGAANAGEITATRSPEWAFGAALNDFAAIP